MTDDPLLIPCQCGRPDCPLWITIQDQDADVPHDRSYFAVAPTHLHPTDQVISLTPGYAIVRHHHTAL